MARKFKADIRRDATCADCGTGYYYFHAVEVDEGGSSKFEGKVRDTVANGVGVAPCPECGDLSPEMWAASVKALQGHLVGIAVSVGILLFSWMILGQGALMFGLLLVGGLSLLGFLIGTISWFLPRRPTEGIPFCPERKNRRRRGPCKAGDLAGNAERLSASNDR